MGTRANYNFTDENGTYSVYKHFDNYPSGAAGFMLNMWAKAWTLPRFEADEAAASFIAANKTEQGGVRLINTITDNDDQEYVYNIFQAKNGQIILRAYNWGKEIFYGRMKDFCLQNMEAANVNKIIDTFHGELDTKFVDTEVSDKIADIRKTVKAALDALDKAKREITDLAVSVGE